MTLSPASSVRGGFPLGLSGATAATRYVGATASGAPASGTFAVGDFAIDQTGTIYVCTVAGTPGTWVAIQSGGSYRRVMWEGAALVDWSNMPAAATTFLRPNTLTDDSTQRVDLTPCTQVFFSYFVTIAGTSGATLLVDYSLDGTTFLQLGESQHVQLGDIGVLGLKTLGWINIAAGARTAVYLRLSGIGGNGADDPRFSRPIAEFR